MRSAFIAPGRVLLATGVIVIMPSVLGAGRVDVKTTLEIREYCHIVRFPKGWGNIEPLNDHSFPPIYHYLSQYEFRVPGLLETKFLVRGLDPVTEHYTANKYEVDLSDSKAIARLASEQAWQAGTPLRLVQRSPWTQTGLVRPVQQAEFHGFQFSKTGASWPTNTDETRLSPDQAWLVLQSWTGTLSHSEDVPLGRVSGRDRGRLFFDVFNADTGKKVVTVIGTYSDINPGDALTRTAWLTERYFIVPLGEHRERCLVCEFGARRRNQGAK